MCCYSLKDICQGADPGAMPTKHRHNVFIVLILLVIAVVAGGWYLLGHGFSSRAEPNAIEAYVAPRLRNLAIPRSARNAKNPVVTTPEVLSEAMEHFADHCAFCHGSDGTGRTDLGQGLYPRPPDLRQQPTQRLTDGELYYIIENGVRFTGMPAFGELSDHVVGEDSWKLVGLIRHFPNLTSQQVKQIDDMMPRSAAELKEQHEIERFLEGGDTPPEAEHHKHTNKE
jgi:mono/diheme cytochrome c family protein